MARIKSISFAFRCQECGSLMSLDQIEEIVAEGDDPECQECGSTDLDIHL